MCMCLILFCFLCLFSWFQGFQQNYPNIFRASKEPSIKTSFILSYLMFQNWCRQLYLCLQLMLSFECYNTYHNWKLNQFHFLSPFFCSFFKYLCFLEIIPFSGTFQYFLESYLEHFVKKESLKKRKTFWIGQKWRGVDTTCKSLIRYKLFFFSENFW